MKNTYNIKLISKDKECAFEYVLNIEAKSFKKAYKKLKRLLKKKSIKYEIHKIHQIEGGGR